MKTKAFDCVRMKREIQNQIGKEFEGLANEEQKRMTEDQIASDPILGPIWRKIKKKQAPGNYMSLKEAAK